MRRDPVRDALFELLVGVFGPGGDFDPPLELGILHEWIIKCEWLGVVNHVKYDFVCFRIGIDDHGVFFGGEGWWDGEESFDCDWERRWLIEDPSFSLVCVVDLVREWYCHAEFSK